MKKTRDDVLIVSDGSVRSPLRWLIARLAKHPGWVTAITFAGGAVVAWVVLEIDGRLTLTDTVTLLATLWALFFAVMIYLLSAEDTDHILGQISDLQDQLSTALAEPEEDGTAQGAAAHAATPVLSAAEPPTRSDAATPHASPEQHPADLDRMVPDSREDAPAPALRPGSAGLGAGLAPGPRPGVVEPGVAEPADARRSRDRRPQILTTPAAIAETVPHELIAGWTRATGLPDSAIRRAWSRDPRRGQWVLETDDERWLAFFRRGDDVALVPLRADSRGGGRSRTPRRRPQAGQPRNRPQGGRDDHRSARP